jgi:hypothetical protein
MYLVVVKDDLNVVRHQVIAHGTLMAERVRDHLREAHEWVGYSVETHLVPEVRLGDKLLLDYPVEIVVEADGKSSSVLKDWERELLGIED